MGGKLERIMSVVEGREINARMANDLLEAARRYGFQARLVKTIDSEKIIENDLRSIFSDFVLWRSPSNYKDNYEIERAVTWVNDNCKITLNTKIEGGRFCTSNKYYQHGLFMRDPVLAQHILPMYPAFSKAYVLSLIENKFINYPFVFKPNFGTRGLGIILINNREDLEKFQGEYRSFSIEPYIKSTYDWRIFTLGGVALGVMKKIGDEEDETNFEAKSGGRQRFKEEDLDVFEEVCRLSIKAAAVSGLEYAGVDVIRDDETGKFYVLETNVAAGWQNGFFPTTGVNVADKTMEWFLDRAELFEQPTHIAVNNYVKKRLSLISRDAQKVFSDVTEFKKKIIRSRDICNIDLVIADVPIERKLESAYILAQDENLKDTDKVRIESFIGTLEKYEISSFGNFIGKSSGSLEDSILNTAYYLAICKKLGKF